MLAHTLACFALLACVSAAPTGGKEHGFMSGAPVLSEDTEYLDFAVKNVRTHLMELSDAVPDKIELIGMTSQVVAGIRYEFFFLVKSANNRVDICQASTWVRPWLSAEYITQLDDPIKCGVPDSVLSALEETANGQSNDLMYAKITGEPKVTVEGATLKIDASLIVTSCTKSDADMDKECTVADDETVRDHCTAEIRWNGTGLDITNVQLGPVQSVETSKED